jgi:hypothetical protein
MISETGSSSIDQPRATPERLPAPSFFSAAISAPADVSIGLEIATGAPDIARSTPFKIGLPRPESIRRDAPFFLAPKQTRILREGRVRAK